MSHFARIAVRKGPKSASMVAGLVGNVDANGTPTIDLPGGISIPLRASMLAITANHQTASAFRTESGSVFSIAVKDVVTDRYAVGDGKRPVETVLELFERNPWNHPKAKVLATLLRG